MNEINELCRIISDIKHPETIEKFFHEIFTEAELKTLSLRWALLKELKQGATQRDIAARLHISLCKITRGAKIIKQPDSVTKKYLDKIIGGKR